MYVEIKSIPSGNMLFESDARRYTCITPAAKMASRALGPSPAIFARPAKQDKVVKMKWNARRISGKIAEMPRRWELQKKTAD